MEIIKHRVTVQVDVQVPAGNPASPITLQAACVNALAKVAQKMNEGYGTGTFSAQLQGESGLEGAMHIMVREDNAKEQAEAVQFTQTQVESMTRELFDGHDHLEVALESVAEDYAPAEQVDG